MSELALPALEGRTIEPKGLRVRDLIEKLQKMDPEKFVVTTDCCYGPSIEVEVYEQEVEEWACFEIRELNLEVGDKYVVVG